MFKLEGMYASLPTIFNEDESINYNGINDLIEHLVDGGVTGVIACGSIGEYTLASMEERKAVIKSVCDIVNNRMSVIAGGGCHRTKDTIEMIRYSKAVGADAVLVITPYYMEFTSESIIEYYKEIASGADIGIIIYHLPKATGVSLDPKLILEISKIDNIIGIKNTDDMDHTSKVITLTKQTKNFAVMNGYDSLLMSVLSTGGDGTMGAIQNLAPKQVMDIYRLIKENNLNGALKIYEKLAPLIMTLEEEPYPGPLKVAIEMLGLVGGPVRKPISQPSEVIREKLRKELINAGLIKDLEYSYGG